MTTRLVMNARKYCIAAAWLIAMMANAETPAPSVAPSGSKSPRALMEEGRRRYGAGDFTGALACFEAAAQRAGGRLDAARALLNAATALYRLDRLDESEAVLNEALRTPVLETQAVAWYNKGCVAIEQAERRAAAGDFGGARDRMAQAVESFRNALRLAPADIETKINFEWALKRLNELEEQARQNQRADQNQPNEQEAEQKPDQQKPEREDEQPQSQRSSPSESTPPEASPNTSETSAPSGEDPGSGAPEMASPQGTAPDERVMTKEDAIRLLDAMRMEEEALRRQLRRRLGVPMPVEKDW